MLQHELFDEVFFSNIQISNKKIDLVYTFVDTNDKIWKIKYEKYAGKKFDTHRHDETHILFSLKTINKYFDVDSINKIYIVSDYHRLNFNIEDLQKIYNKIIYVDHEDIIPKKYLPTFNSMVIEAFLWNIPNISDTFIYLNDDFLLGKYVDRTDFFEDNTPIQFFHRLGGYGHAWYNNIKSSNKLFEQKFGIYVGITPQHAPYHIVTNIYKKVYDIFKEDLKFMFEKRKTRKYDEYSHNLMFLYGMYAHYQKLVLSKRTSFSHIFSFPNDFIEKTKDIANRRKFYAISSKIKKDQRENFIEFQKNLLR
jgi:hypothetical protein